MRVLGLTSYPVESAATRFRVGQFVGPLRQRGIELELSPFLDGDQFAGMYSPGGGLRKAAGLIPPFFRRLSEVFSAGRYDLLFVQREAMFFGPAMFEFLMQQVGGLPMVLDLDDATYIPYRSPSYGRLGSSLKFFGKTDSLIGRAAHVTCGNRFIGEYVESKGTKAVVIPTVVDTEVFCPVDKDNDVPVIGWIGTHSTFPILEKLFPVLTRLAAEHKFILRIIGSGQKVITIDGVNVETLDWDMEREVSDFQHLDIGLYPMFLTKSANTAWINGKSGFKAIQYMSVGVPFVMSPVGVCAEIGEPGMTHFNADSHEDWYNSLDKLLSSKDLRAKMGISGRNHSLSSYTVGQQSAILAYVLLSTVNKKV